MSLAQENWKSLKPKAHRKTQLKFDFHLRFLLCIAGPDYNIGIVGNRACDVRRRGLRKMAG